MDWIVCAGNRRTGSTLHYHLVREIVERTGLGKGAGAVPGGAAPAEPNWHYSKVKQNGITVLRTHRPTPDIMPIIQTVSTAKTYIYRDIRDMIVSLINLEGRDLSYCLGTWFKDRVKIDRFWRDQKNLLITKYEDLIMSLEYEVLRIQNFLFKEFKLPPGEVLELCDTYSIENVKALIESGQQHDPAGAVADCGQKQMFLNRHIFSGEAGQWKEFFSPKEKEQINKRVGFFVREQGYEV